MSGIQRAAAAVLLPVTLLAACGQADPPSTGTAEVAGDVLVPAEPIDAPAVVLVPGGGWVNADPSGLRPLAEALAERGIVVVTTTYRAAELGGDVESMVAEVACAMRLAARTAREAAGADVPVVPIGHSAGAHLVALAVLADGEFIASCPDPPAEVAGFVGIAGPYDIARIPDVAFPMFGVAPSDQPERWRAGNPLTYAAAHPDMPVLLVHGAADELVPIDFTSEFADAMSAAGHEVESRIIPAADHLSVFEPEISGDVIAEWLLGLTS
jgi:acetyl esterase/lipase